MSTITDLTGTTWEITSTECTAGYGQFYINYSRDSYSFSSMYIGYAFLPPDGFIPAANSILNIEVQTISVGDILEITGGSDSTDLSLISWLESHATQIVELSAVSISKIIDSNNNTGYFTSQSYFTSSSTASSTTKTATHANSATFSDTSLEIGVSVHIQFTYANTASSYTLQVGTSTAKPVSLVAPWVDNSLVTFTYDGTSWIQNDVRPAVRSIKIGDTVVSPDNNGVATVTSAINDLIDASLPGAIIEFSIYKRRVGTRTYEAEDGMTWTAWVASAYNTDGYIISGNSIYDTDNYELMLNSAPVSASDYVGEGYEYFLSNSG